MGNASYKLTYGCVVSVCCIDFASLDVVCDEIYYCALNICSSFLCVCMFIVLKALLIECHSDCLRRGAI